MTTMYLLMSVFHSPPWLKLISSRFHFHRAVQCNASGSLHSENFGEVRLCYVVALRPCNSTSQIAEQISFSKQALAAGFSQYDLGICRVGDAQAYLHWQVRLDEAGHYTTVRSGRCVASTR